MGDSPLVPGLADTHACQQLGAAQEPEDRYPHLLVGASLAARVLEGGQRQQRRGRRHGGGVGHAGAVLVRGGGGGGQAADTGPVGDGVTHTSHHWTL